MRVEPHERFPLTVRRMPSASVLADDDVPRLDELLEAEIRVVFVAALVVRGADEDRRVWSAAFVGPEDVGPQDDSVARAHLDIALGLHRPSHWRRPPAFRLRPVSWLRRPEQTRGEFLARVDVQLLVHPPDVR